MEAVKKIWQQANTLSLDVVAGAVFSSAFASKIFGVTPTPAYWVILPIAVWVVYTADHLVDAYRLRDKAHTQRHLFHYQYFGVLGGLVATLSVLNALLAILFLDAKTIMLGIMVGGFSLLYLTAVHFWGNRRHLFLQKEFFVAVIYISGVWGAPWVMSGFDLQGEVLMLFILFALLALSDLIVLSLYESTTDTLDGHPTLIGYIGKKTTRTVCFFILALIFIGAIFILIYSPIFMHRAAAKIYLLMSLLMVVVMALTEPLSRHNLYRYMAELVFWLPGILLLL